MHWKYVAPCTGKAAFEVRRGPAPMVSDCVDCCDTLPRPDCPERGNGHQEGAEECDDGNNTGGDGCCAFCRTE